MGTYSLDLEFMDDSESDLHHSPTARVCVKMFSRATADGSPLITLNCVTIGELESEIDRLKSELEAIRKKARAKFSADDKRQSARARADV